MKIKLLIFSLLCSVVGWGQILIPDTTPVTQNFDSMGASATASLPANWKMSPAGAASPTWAAGGNVTAVTQQASSGAPATGARYNWGDSGAVNRALGVMTSGSFASPNSIMAFYRNTNASNLTQLTVSYNLERYRINTAAASVQFYYSLDGTSWTAVTAGDVAAASLPTGASTYTFVTPLVINVGAFNITGLNIPTNSDVYLRWNLNTTGGNSQGIGIDDVSVTASFTVGCTAPTTQASVVTTTGETLDGFTVNWTAGNGNGTMIVVSDAAVVAPTSGTAYVPNLAWASAAQINTNNRVIFRAAGATAGPITGLASGAQYSVRAYEYNTTGNCYATPGATATGYTRALEPTTHATTFTCTTASSSQINLSFTDPTTLTNGKGYLVLQKIGSAPTGTPTDGVFYAAGATIGDATVVGYTTGPTSYNVTGLTPGTNYYFSLLPYISYLSVVVIFNYNNNATIPTTNCTTTGIVSNLSDIVAVATSESATVSSTINNASPLTSATGVQVWQFTVRDGGASSPDADTLPTILTAFNIAQGAGNQVSTWSDGINAVDLFDGATWVASGTVTANQIQFSGLNVIVADGATKTLSLRLSLKCPLGAGAIDGDDFVFSISNGNTTFSPAGSGKTTFTAAASANGQNVISVVATRLAFTTQPATTGVNIAMSNVVVTATDACGNKDLGFTGNVVLTSTGTMTGSPITVAAVAGVATFSSVIHTVVGTGLTMNAASTGLTSGTSTAYNITIITVFSQGDFAVIAVNSNISCYPAGPNGLYSAGDDEISFITFKDIQTGDTFYITDNGYERTTAGLWGDTEGVTQLTRTGATIPAGTVITIRLRNVAPIMEFVSPDTNWSFAKAAGFGGSLVLNTGGDQIFFMQGGVWNNPAGTHDATYTPGTFLYAFNTNVAWNSFGTSTQQSGLPIELTCFNLKPGTATDFLEYTGPVTPAAKLDWIARLNDPANWTDRSNCAGYTQMHNGQSYTVLTGGTFVDGVWTGAKSTDWFDCSNWQTLKVPDQTVNVDVNATYATKDAVIDITSPNAATYSNIAESNNLSLSSRKIVIEGNTNNRLDVYGNLVVNSPGILDMNDGNNATADGRINLYGNWTNNAGNVSFEEGNGTVTFTGATPQIINNVTPEGTETFNHLILNNNFDTSVSNDIIAKGNLTVNATKTLNIASNDFAEVTFNVVNNGAVNIQDDGSLVQLDDTGTYSGSGTNSMVRVAGNIVPLKLFDYVYWSSPVASAPFSTIPNSRFYEWDADIVNPVGYGQGNWIGSADPSMQLGKGYIFRVPNANATQTVTFSGSLFNNAVVNKTINKGTITAPFAGVNAPITEFDDNWNLVGNPYPSAIDTQTFATNNSGALEDGTVYLWRHLTAITTAASPYYETFLYNYSGSDYVKHNGTASIPAGAFAGKIGAGQAFFVKMKESLGSSTTLQFSNSLRSRSHSNSQFFRTTNPMENETKLEKSRIWLDLVNPNKMAVTQVVAYVEDATNDDDFYFDSKTAYKSGFGFYSLIKDVIFDIQARALPFDKKDFIPLGVQLPIDGTYAIAINQVDGIFANKKQKIYVEDKLNGTLHNLTEAPYEFVGKKGIFNDRFVLRYVDKNKKGIDVMTIVNEVYVNTSIDGIQIISKELKIANYEVYNVLGQSIAVKNAVNTNKVYETSIQKNNQPLLIKIQLEDGQSIVKKIIF